MLFLIKLIRDISFLCLYVIFKSHLWAFDSNAHFFCLDFSNEVQFSQPYSKMDSTNNL